ncbi:hypothetical protein OUZ56_011783 [Daphnia magna]|uniref:Uncharacterized protein n=1 Tax=Daphnia magna TaxID=35525 RepID=A0ABQ9Z2F8_9CRUS|nr:hypothetical protein OUZ56_011783 [Daphnia magna]
MQQLETARKAEERRVEAARKKRQLQMELEKQRYTGSLSRKQLADELAVAEETDEMETSGFDKTDVWKPSVVPSHPPATFIPNFRIPCVSATSTQPCSQYELAASEQPSTSDQQSSSIPKLNANASSYVPPNVLNQPNPSIAQQFTSSARPSLIPTTTMSAQPGHNRVMQQTFPPQRTVHASQPTVHSPDAWIFAVNRHDAPPTFRSSSRPPKAEPPNEYESIKQFSSTLRSVVTTLQLGGYGLELHSSTSFAQLVGKLPPTLRSKWAEFVRVGVNPTPHQVSHPKTRENVHRSSNEKQKKSTTTPVVFSTTVIIASCPYCGGAHRLYLFEKFKALNPTERSEIVKEKRRCYRVLDDRHLSSECTKEMECGTDEF